MKITVVTVCFNAVKELEETMLSVLGQDYPYVEYIVIDGGSTDGTVDIIRKYADRLAYWVSEPDKGIYDAMNKGIAAATGDYINFMNAGDKFASNDILSKVAQVQNAPGVIYGDLFYIDNGQPQLRHPRPLDKLWQRASICHQSAFFANDKEVLYYNLQYRIAADHDLFCRLYYNRHWTFEYIPTPICIYAGGGVSEHNNNCIKEFKQIAKPYKPLWLRIPTFLWIDFYERISWGTRKTLGESIFRYLSLIKKKLLRTDKV